MEDDGWVSKGAGGMRRRGGRIRMKPVSSIKRGGGKNNNQPRMESVRGRGRTRRTMEGWLTKARGEGEEGAKPIASTKLVAGGGPGTLSDQRRPVTADVSSGEDVEDNARSAPLVVGTPPPIVADGL